MDRGLGRDCILYRNTASFGTPTFAAIATVNDPQETAQRPTAEIRGRGDDIVIEKPGARRSGYSFQSINVISDTGLLALRTAYLAGTTVLLWFADGAAATVGTTGLHAEFYVTQFARNEPDEGAVVFQIEVKPASTTNWEMRTTSGG